MNRRNFLMGAAGLALTRAARAQDRAAKLARVGAMSGNFGNLLTEVRDWSTPGTPGKLDIMDFPEMLADRYGMHWVEVQQIHFLDMSPSYYAKFLDRVKKAKSKMCDMPLELDDKGYAGMVSPTSQDPALRAKAIDLTKKWIDRAAMIECPSVMVNQGTGLLPDDLGPAIAGFKELVAYGKPKNVAVIMENRGRTPPERLVELMKASGAGANPDIGNFADEETRARGLRLMYPLAVTVSHVKKSARFDFANAIRISKEMNFKGVYSLEGGGPDPYAANQQLLDALLENL